jgi:hypothetical protein
MSNRWVGLGVAGLLLAGVVAPAGAGAATPASSHQPAHATALTHGTGDFRNAVRVLAGSPSRLVYEQLTNTGERGLYGHAVLTIRTLNGSTKTLPLPPHLRVPVSHNDAEWSLVGHSLTDLSSGDPDVIYWWNVATGAHGEHALPVGRSYVGSSPDGWIYTVATKSHPHGEVFDQPAAGGPATSLDGPEMPAGDGFSPIGAVGPDGYALLVSGANQSGQRLVFSAWGSSTYSTIDTFPEAAAFVSCRIEAYDAVGCVEPVADNQIRVVRVPTSGAADVETDPRSGPIGPEVGTGSGFPRVLLTKSATGWTEPTSRLRDGFVVADSLFTAPATTGAPVSQGPALQPVVAAVAFNQLDDVLTAAFGAFIVASGSPGHDAIASTDSAADPLHVVASATEAPIHANLVHISGHRVVYADDKHSYNGGDIYAETVTGSKLRHHSTPKPILSTDSQFLALDSSHSTVAVVIAAPETVPHTSDQIEAVYRGRHTIVTGTNLFGDDALPAMFKVSGHYVLYADASDGQPRILNAATGKDASAGLGTHVQAATIGDHQLIYVHANGSVWERAISGSTSHRLFANSAGVSHPVASVTAGGGYALATYYSTSRDEDPYPIAVAAYRRINGNGPVVVTSHTLNTTDILQATARGIVTGTPAFTVQLTTLFTQLTPWRTTHAHTVLHRTYSDVQEAALLDGGHSVQSGDVGVSIAGSLIAWIDRHGRLHAGRIR